MANGRIALATTEGGIAGLSAGPIGGAVGAAAGFVSADFKGLFGHKKKTTPVPTPVPWYRNPVDIEVILAVGVIMILTVAIKRKR